MPFKAEKDSSCPTNKPWAAKNSDTGKVHGCHATKAQAQDQVKALYANVPDAKKGKKATAIEEYPQIVRAITGTPWLIVPENFQAILDIVNMRLSGEAFSDEEIRIRLEAAKDQERENPRVAVDGGVGILSLYGPVFPKANLMTELSGATSLETFANDFRQVVEDDLVKQVIIDFNTPGGNSDMVMETGQIIREARSVKPIYGIANTTSASAGLWLLSQTSKAYATPSGRVGSLGVYVAHEDRTGEDAQLGRKITIVSAGDYKSSLDPHEPLSEEGKAYLKETVEELHTEFINEVAAGRGLDPEFVRENFGKGKLLSPTKAKEVGMIDGVMSMQTLIDGLVESNYQHRSTRVRSDLAHSVSKMQSAYGSEGGLLRTTSSEIQVVDSTQAHVESKEWEHSEPGTGSPPQPRQDEDGSDDKAIKGGWRVDTPPEPPFPANVNTKSLEGGNVDDRTEVELRKVLGIDENADMVEAARIRFGELQALQDAVSASDQERIFAEQYPQFWSEHNDLMKRDRKNTAEKFVASVDHLRKAEGPGLKTTKMALSTKAKDTLTELHVKFSEGGGNVMDFETAVKAIVNGGVVQFGEIGSSAGDDLPELDTTTAGGVAQSRKIMADLVAKVQAEEGIDFRTALKKVAAKHPDLASAYQQALPA